jgi:hypothetical protein
MPTRRWGQRPPIYLSAAAGRAAGADSESRLARRMTSRRDPGAYAGESEATAHSPRPVSLPARRASAPPTQWANVRIRRKRTCDAQEVVRV